jgi:MSHA biogenesis protein MshP
MRTAALCRSPRHPVRAARGASSLLVIAVMVLLGGLSVYVTGLVSSVSNGYAMEMNLARARQAAESGLEWGRYVMLQNGAACTAVQNVVMPGSLAPYTVTVRCSTGGADLAGPPASFVQYRLSVTACNIPSGGNCPNTSIAPGSDYVERRLTALVDR